MEKEREKSSKKDTKTGFAALGDNEKVYLQKNGVQETDDSPKYIWKDIDCKIVAIFDSNTRSFVKSVSTDNDGLVGVILDKTSFYGESGGQTGDIGFIDDGTSDDNKSSDPENAFKVNDVQEFAGFIVHIGEVTNGTINVDQTYKSKVDYDNRKNIAPNHTMTHVLNLALREVLGTEANQKGSLVDADKLRFDYSTNKPLSMDQISKVSGRCNDIIDSKLKVFTDTIQYKQATSINALRAMFGERYPEKVRVVSIGIEPKEALKKPTDENNFNYSIELCGGTHLSNTSEAGDFVFLSDDALSAGIRRVVALTGKGAKRAIQDANELNEEFKEASSLDGGMELSKKCSELSFKVDNARIGAVEKSKLRKDLKVLKDKDRAYQKDLGKQRKKKVIEIISKINMDTENGNFIIKRIDVGLDKKALKEGIKKFYKNKDNAGVPIMLISCSPNDKNKIIILSEIPKATVKKGIHCGKWVECTLPFIDGPTNWKGGKGETKAEVQGTTMSNVAKVMDVASKYINDNYKL